MASRSSGFLHLIDCFTWNTGQMWKVASLPRPVLPAAKISLNPKVHLVNTHRGYMTRWTFGFFNTLVRRGEHAGSYTSSNQFDCVSLSTASVRSFSRLSDSFRSRFWYAAGAYFTLSGE